MNRLRLIALAAMAILLPAASRAEPAPTPLIMQGKPRFDIVIAAGKNERIEKAAHTLQSFLEKITGATVAVKTGDGKTGIVLGLPGQFPGLPFSGKWKNPSPAQREDYLLRSHPGGVYLIGATELAVEHAVWDLLYRLGVRQYFPGKHWEVVPRQPSLSVAVDVEESPDYHSRRIWYGFGTWDYNSLSYAEWCARNRATSGIVLNTGHSYGGLISKNQAEFDRHPEYRALIDGKRNLSGQAKLCIGTPELRKLIVASALRTFQENPALDSISMDPSDGGGWCECDLCAKVGSVSDRAVLLANDVADGVNAKYPGKLVGMYAYAYHSPPPTIKVHPQVVISVATSFLRGGLTLDEIIKGWAEKGATLGIREYYSVHTWDRDLPGQARGARLDYLRRTIPEFHSKGARFLSAESSDNWGPNGLGYHVAARLLWDVKEADRVAEIVDDFLTRAFGPAKAAMKEFYEQIDGSQTHLVFDDQLGRMFRSLQEARKLADSPEIQARINDLILYSRYVDLFQRYRTAKGTERQQAFEALIRHAYRMRKTMMVHTKAVYRDIVRRDKGVTIPAGATWNVAEGKNPWKSSEPFSQEELSAFLKDGTERYQLVKLDFKPVSYSGELVSAGKLDLGKTATAGDFGPGRSLQTFYTVVEKAPAKIELQITGGLIVGYRDRGNVRVELWQIGGASQTGEKETKIAEDRSVPPDGKERTVTLTVPQPGVYRLTVQDGGDRTRVRWTPGTRLVVLSSTDEPMNRFYSGWNAYFYVPRGTRVLGFFGGGRGDILDPSGKVAFTFSGKKDSFYSVPIPESQDGKLWRVRNGLGDIRLLTVPPYFARTPEELILPREVVERDRRTP